MKHIFLCLFLLFSLNATVTGQETKLHPAQILSLGALDGQALIYNSATDEFEPQNLPTGADNWGAQVVQSDASLTGEGTTGSPLSVDPSQINSSEINNDAGFVTENTQLSQQEVRNSYNGQAAAGDLSGTYPDPVVLRIRGYLVRSTAPELGEFLRWDGGGYAPAPIDIDDADADPSNEIQTISRSTNSITVDKGGGTESIVDTYTQLIVSPVSGNTVTLASAIDLGRVNNVRIVRGLPQSIAASGNTTDVTISPDGLTLTFNHRGFDGTEEVRITYISQ